MNNRYLCKAKDKDDGRWYEGYYLLLHDTTYCCMPSDNAEETKRFEEKNTHHYIVFEQMTDWGLPNRHLRAEILPETLCQCTGLKNFFEKDIVKRTDLHRIGEPSIGIIEYDVENTAFVIHWIDKQVYSPMYPWKDKIKVIGSTIDNPELLEVEE